MASSQELLFYRTEFQVDVFPTITILASSSLKQNKKPYFSFTKISFQILTSSCWKLVNLFGNKLDEGTAKTPVNLVFCYLQLLEYILK